MLRVVPALVLLLATAQLHPIKAECSGSGCRLYLPLVGGRHRLDLGEYGPEGPRWRYLGQTDRIWDMAYDARGHLWTATAAGLVEWPSDGAPPTRHSLTSIRRVAVDQAGGVWFGGSDGAEALTLTRLAPDGGLTTRSLGGGGGSGIGLLQALVADGLGNVFAAWTVDPRTGGGGLTRIGADGAMRSWRGTSDGLKREGVGQLAVDGGGGVWFTGIDTATGRVAPGLGRLTVDGQIRYDAAGPPEVTAGPVVDLATDAAGGLVVVVEVEQRERVAAQMTRKEGRASGSDMGVTRLFQRDASGLWSALDLPLADANALRPNPLEFDPGPRAAVVGDDGVLWVVLEGIAVAVNLDGKLVYWPGVDLSRTDGDIASALAARLGAGTVLVPNPQGGVALAASEHPGWMMIGGPQSAAKTSLQQDPAALPVVPRNLAFDAAGRAWLSDENAVWQEGSAGWIRRDDERMLQQPHLPRWKLPNVGPVLVSPDDVHWIGDGPKLLRISPDRRERVTISAEQGLTGGDVLCLGLAPDGTLWVGTTRGLAHLDAFGRWTTIRGDDLPSPVVSDLAFDSQGNLWLALDSSDSSDAGMRGGAVARVSVGQGVQAWSSAEVHAAAPGSIPGAGGERRLVVMRDGTVWAAGGLGLASKAIGEAWRPRNQEAGIGESVSVTDLAEDARGQLWIASEYDGVRRYDPISDRWSHYQGQDKAGGSILSLVADAVGNVWFGLGYSGVPGPASAALPLGMAAAGRGYPFAGNGRKLVRRDRDGKWTSNFVDTAAVFVGMDWIEHLAIAPDGTLLGTMTGDRLLVFHGDIGGVWMPQDRLPSVGASVNAMPMCRAANDRLWILPPEGAASRGTGAGWHVLHTADGLPEKAYGAMACALDGSVWLGPRYTERDGSQPESLVRLLPDGQIQRYDIPHPLPGEGARAVAAAGDGSVAVAFARWPRRGDDGWPNRSGPVYLGLAVRDPMGQWRRFGASALAVSDLRTLVFDSSGTLWIASDQGVLRMPSGGRPQFQSGEGLPSPDVRGLAWARGRLWAATAAGAAELLPDGRWRSYDQGDGLSEDTLRDVVAGPDGEVWFLTQQGAISILEP
ncbi:MAG: hypothetical protein IPJ58_05810 [Ardenticatenia bacterium]|nr:hypothetical protein [Ardenticatenia bacterium]